MSKTKRHYMPELYELIDGVKASEPTHEELEQQAKQAVCACWYYDLANEAEYMTADDLKAIIADPYHVHKVNMDDLNECPMYQAEQAETIRDARREDGENV